MKKVVIAMVALLMGASLSLAGLGIQWAGSWVVAFGQDPSDAEAVFIADNNDVLWQLIFTTDSEAAEPNLKADHFLGGENETWLADRTVPQGGGTDEKGVEWASWLEQTGGDDAGLVWSDKDWNQLGFVYQRIWEGVPEATTTEMHYFDSELLALVESDLGYVPGGTSAPTVSNYDPIGEGVAADKTAGTVPEPATMSLLGLGALAMVLRRKMSK